LENNIREKIKKNGRFGGTNGKCMVQLPALRFGAKVQFLFCWTSWIFMSTGNRSMSISHVNSQTSSHLSGSWLDSVMFFWFFSLFACWLL